MKIATLRECRDFPAEGEAARDCGFKSKEIGDRSQPFDPFDYAKSKQAQGRNPEFSRETSKTEFPSIAGYRLLTTGFFDLEIFS